MPLVVIFERVRVVAGSFEIGDILAGPVLKVCQTKCGLVAEVGHLCQKANIGVGVGAQPAD